jgi:hypothetical protein
MKPSLIRGFLEISVALEDVELRDSLWSIHKNVLLGAKNVYVSVNTISIFSGSIKIMDNEKKMLIFFLWIVLESEIPKFLKRRSLPMTIVEF